MKSSLLLPTEYFRNFSNDILAGRDIETFQESCKRIAVVALPYIALYRPAGFTLTLCTGALRVFTDISKFRSKKESGVHLLHVAMSVAAIAGTVFAHPLGMFLATIQDLGSALKDGSYLEILSNALYLGMFFGAGPGLCIAQLFIQMITLLRKAKIERARGNDLESIAHLGMAIIRGNQMVRRIDRQMVDIVISYLRKPVYAMMECTLQKSLKTILYFPFIPLTGVLFGIALVIDTLAQKIFPREFTYWEGNGVSKSGLPKKIFTWNVCMLFGGLPIQFGGVAPVEKRVNDVAEKILALNPDLIALQEVSEPAARLLFEKLQSEYKHFYTRIDPETYVGLDSALFVASKMPLENPALKSLPRMGLMRRALFSFNIGSLNFLTTHLEPGIKIDDQRVRQRQVECALENGVSTSTIMLGDLNMEREGEFQQSLLSKVFHDIFSGVRETATDFFSAKVRKIDPINQSIDYILATPDIELTGELISGYDKDKWAQSDHHALFATLKEI